MKLTVSGGLLVGITRSLDWSLALDHVRPSSAWLLILGVLCAMTTTVLGGMRWRCFVESMGVRLTRLDSVGYAFVAQSFNSLLPSTIGGDAARIIAATRDGVTVSVAIAATALDRFTGLFISTLAGLVVLLLEPFGLVLPPVFRMATVLLVGAFVAALLLTVGVRVRGVPTAFTAWFTKTAPTLAVAVAGVRVSPRALAFAAVWTTGMLAGLAIACDLLSSAGPSPGLGILRSAAIAGVLVLVTALPVSVAGWGVRELMMVNLFESMGFAPEHGLATSILLGLATLVANLPGAPIWLFSVRRDRRVKLEEEQS